MILKATITKEITEDAREYLSTKLLLNMEHVWEANEYDLNLEIEHSAKNGTYGANIFNAYVFKEGAKEKILHPNQKEAFENLIAPKLEELGYKCSVRLQPSLHLVVSWS